MIKRLKTDNIFGGYCTDKKGEVVYYEDVLSHNAKVKEQLEIGLKLLREEFFDLRILDNIEKALELIKEVSEPTNLNKEG